NGRREAALHRRPDRRPAPGAATARPFASPPRPRVLQRHGSRSPRSWKVHLPANHVRLVLLAQNRGPVRGRQGDVSQRISPPRRPARPIAINDIARAVGRGGPRSIL
ncbi:hypothetical protein GGH91_006397, partial [Coemansia sp. RSA 2671]